jgi:hypothetical protein
MMTGIEWGEIDLVVILSIALPIILLLNGIYDIVCAYSILYVKNKHFFFANIHKDMYVNEADFKERYFSYWIFLNGVVRMISSTDPRLYSIASVTYFVESLVFTREYTMVRMKLPRVLFVVVSSFILGVLCSLPMSGFFAKSCCGFL